MLRIKSSLLPAILAALLLAACRPSSLSPSPTAPSPTSTLPQAPPPTSTLPPALKSGQIGGFLMPYAADGENWPPNVEVTIQVYDQPQGNVIFTGKSKTNAAGHFFQDVGVTTIPGMVVAVTDGTNTQSVVLVPLAITNINPTGDTVSGTATNSARVFLQIGDNSQSAELWATTSEAGQWQADFLGHFDITETTAVQASIRDTSGNGTVFKIDPQ